MKFTYYIGKYKYLSNNIFTYISILYIYMCIYIYMYISQNIYIYITFIFIHIYI